MVRVKYRYVYIECEETLNEDDTLHRIVRDTFQQFGGSFLTGLNSQFRILKIDEHHFAIRLMRDHFMTVKAVVLPKIV